MSDWIYTKDKLPEEDGLYFVAVRDCCDDPDTFGALNFTTDLYDLSSYFFEDKKGIPGFYSMDTYDNEYYHEENVIAWMPIPELED